ncbi:MAG: hypothetical protein AB7I01_13255 [Gammaproteobacteria bacterium]
MPPVRPRDAASLIIHRQRFTHHEVLMGRRGQKARFKPGVYVFPGGGLERGDYHAQPARALAEHIVPQLAVAQSRAKATALAMAAVREASEEAGLMLGVPGTVGRVSHDTWARFRDAALAPDLGALEFLGRAITPSYQPIRYHARFFAAHADLFSGELGGDGELEDLRWVRLDDLGGIEMMEVQALMLETLRERLAGREVAARRMFFQRGRRQNLDA